MLSWILYLFRFAFCFKPRFKGVRDDLMIQGMGPINKTEAGTDEKNKTENTYHFFQASENGSASDATRFCGNRDIVPGLQYRYCTMRTGIGSRSILYVRAYPYTPGTYRRTSIYTQRIYFESFSPDVNQ